MDSPGLNGFIDKLHELFKEETNQSFPYFLKNRREGNNSQLFL